MSLQLNMSIVEIVGTPLPLSACSASENATKGISSVIDDCSISSISTAGRDTAESDIESQPDSQCCSTVSPDACSEAEESNDWGEEDSEWGMVDESVHRMRLVARRCALGSRAQQQNSPDVDESIEWEGLDAVVGRMRSAARRLALGNCR